MVRFLIVFFSLYVAMHVFVVSRARVLLPQTWPARLLFGLFLMVMICAPVATRLLERGGHEQIARVAAYAGFVWMALIFLCFCGFFVTAACDLLLRLAGLAFGTNPLNLSGRAPTAAIIALACLMLFYGFFEARDIRVERVTIKTPKLRPEQGTIKIALISDVHLGLIVRGARLKMIVGKIRDADPDILVSTGDLVDGTLGHLDELHTLLADIKPRYGKFAITGNHEFYAGLEESLRFFERAGFTTLRDSSVTVAGLINIAGVDDSRVRSGSREKWVLSQVQNGLFTILLKHRPQPSDEAAPLFDLQLSGHAHRGQIFPFNYFVKMVYPYLEGLYTLKNGSQLYVNRGTGTWGPPMRVLAPPEVTLVELVGEARAG